MPHYQNIAGGKIMISIVAGKFDPAIHDGHADHIIKAARLGDYIIVITHKDDVVAKYSDKKFCAVSLRTRLLCLRGFLMAIGVKGTVIVAKDDDELNPDGTVIKTLEWIRQTYPKEDLIFAKGGDRDLLHMDSREIGVCERLKIKIEYGVGDLLNSSTKIYSKIKNEHLGSWK